MCIIVFDEDRLDAWIYDLKENAISEAIKLIQAAKEENFSIIVSTDTEEVYRRLKAAKSTKEFLTRLEIDATIIK